MQVLGARLSTDIARRFIGVPDNRFDIWRLVISHRRMNTIARLALTSGEDQRDP